MVSGDVEVLMVAQQDCARCWPDRSSHALDFYRTTQLC